jgi:hypothetical protein
LLRGIGLYQLGEVNQVAARGRAQQAVAGVLLDGHRTRTASRAQGLDRQVQGEV